MSALVPVSPAHGGPPERPGRTLADLVPVFCGWFRTMRGAAENTVKAYGESLSAFARFCASADVTRPEAVSFQLVEMYLATLTERRGLKATSANRHLHAIRSFFKFLRRNGQGRRRGQRQTDEETLGSGHDCCFTCACVFSPAILLCASSRYSLCWNSSMSFSKYGKASASRFALTSDSAR